jgi:hypothetical protein
LSLNKLPFEKWNQEWK